MTEIPEKDPTMKPVDSQKTQIPATAYVTRYLVTKLPPDSISGSIWSCTVEWRNANQWAVIHMGLCLDVNGELVYEPLPSSREPEFIKRTRFDLETALAKADDLADNMIINGKTWRDVASHPYSQSAAG